ncbi:hypothetical protein HDA32_001869 [Spinactinospora alkalitolerans]|uniref:F5/8 type C domain-containing protein n=1 Tax=Spinactinospora alkalitolerans TaxID=687207 RepID=A0A852TRV8_9ACTN|nr:discoidin domain-containing protein [Spinactinospora alkalitolerans]NYE46749.1 hypothetical protein [Spinactinospora alkalitolerans]
MPEPARRPAPAAPRPPRSAARASTLTALALTGALTCTATPALAEEPTGSATIEPELISEIDTSAAGGGARMLLGDVDGDGRRDIVMMQPTYSADDRYIGRQVQALTAYDITGEMLWQAGTPDPRVERNGTDIPAQIHDLDGDGRNEVVAVMDDRFTVLDGGTGDFVRDFALPHPEAHDAIAFADFRGTGRPNDILLKDRYNQIWALDDQGEVLWTHEGDVGHYPWPVDLDGDGRQELMAGYDLLDSDGSVLWSADMADHADTMWMGDVDGDGETNVVLGGAETVAHDTEGNEVWRNNETVESQNVILGDFRPDLPGLETLGLDRIDRSDDGVDGLFLIDSEGSMVFQEDRRTRGCWGSIPGKVHNWDGEHSDLMMAWNRGCGELPSVFNGDGDVVTRFEVDGRLQTADLCGDDKEEIVNFVLGETARVYANGGCDPDSHVTGEPLPQTKQYYNFTRYTAGEQPFDHAPAGTARGSSARDGSGADLATDGDPATAWRPAPRDGRPSWLVDLGTRREITSLLLTPRTGARVDYRVESSTDRESWTELTSGTFTGKGEQEHDVTGIGRYVRVSFDRAGPAGLADIRVLGNR